MNETNQSMSIGQRIRNAREKSGVSQKKLAELVGYESSTAISLIESGQREVGAKTLEKIAEVLKCDVNFLLGREVDAPNIEYALRADKNLTREDEDKIQDFIEFIKSKNDRGNKPKAE